MDWDTSGGKRRSISLTGYRCSDDVEHRDHLDQLIPKVITMLRVRSVVHPSRVSSTKIVNLESTHALPPLHPFPETKTLLPQQSSAPVSMATLPTTNELVKDESSSKHPRRTFTRQTQTPLLLVLFGLGLIGIIGVLLAVTLLVKRGTSSTSVTSRK